VFRRRQSSMYSMMGVEAALDFCRRRPELAAILVTESPRSGTVEVQNIGLSASDWRKLE